jgi:hypothetical protein
MLSVEGSATEMKAFRVNARARRHVVLNIRHPSAYYRGTAVLLERAPCTAAGQMLSCHYANCFCCCCPASTAATEMRQLPPSFFKQASASKECCCGRTCLQGTEHIASGLRFPTKSCNLLGDLHAQLCAAEATCELSATLGASTMLRLHLLCILPQHGEERRRLKHQMKPT